MSLVRAFITPLLSTIAAVCFMAAAVLGLAGLAAWADYQNLHCPGAYQCSDAASTIWVAGILAPLSLVLAVGIIWFRWKRSAWGARRRA